VTVRAVVLALAFVASGCGAHLLPTTIAHVPMPPDATVGDADLARVELDSAVRVAARADLSADEWLVWLVSDAGSGALARVRRTELGLEVQSRGAHVGAAIRPSVRVLVVRGIRIVVVESSTSEQSTNRDAWLYAEHGPEIVLLTLDGAPARIPVRAERTTPLPDGWARSTTLTATFEAGPEGIVVHEHASVRELAEGRPELPARSTHEIERARVLRRAQGRLTADRESLIEDGV
jgi:hypothetical protein